MRVWFGGILFLSPKTKIDRNNNNATSHPRRGCCADLLRFSRRAGEFMSNVTKFPSGKKTGGRGRPPTGNSGERLLSMNALGQLLGVDRSVITKWCKLRDAPCPTVHNPDDGSGKGWTFDMGDVWRWHEQHVRQAAINATLAAHGGIDGELLDWDERTKRARAIDKELDLGIKQGDLLFAEDVAAKRDEEHGRFAQELRSIPAKAAKDINPKDQTRIQGILERYHDAALTRLAKGGVDDDAE
jgi:hypothetical protein